MDDLTAFVNARLDEDEAAAWSVHDVAKCDALLYEEDLPGAAARTPVCDCGYPARVLREVEAKRAILELHAMPDEGMPGQLHCGEYHDWFEPCCPTVRLLAAVYSDHPDYRQEWARE